MATQNKKNSTAKKKTTPTRRKNTKKKNSKKLTVKQKIMRFLLSLGLKIGLIVVAISLIVAIYFDQVVRSRFDGQLWQLPASVYSRPLELHAGMYVDRDDIQQELDALNYAKVRTPQRPGEYSASSTKIELYRRRFAFPDGVSSPKHVMLSFSNGQLTQIATLPSRKTIKSIKIEPLMLGMLSAGNEEQRIFLPREAYPEVLLDALLMTEDRHFYQHEGISPLGILRALVVNVKAGRTVQGGSTLTQQLAKNLFLTHERTLWRKIRELYIALIIDYRYNKDRILEAYLNEVYLGQARGKEIHGFALASHLYFGRPIQDLRIDQLALLVGLVKGPAYYNPWRHPERALQRRNIVLRLLQREGILTLSQYEQLVMRDMDIQSSPKVASKQPAYFQQLRIEIKRYLGDAFSSDRGWRIFTSLDPVSQNKLEMAIKETIPQLEKKSGKGLETAAVILDRETGEIRAMVGGANPDYAGFNRALNAKRQIGSLAKPSVYLTALSQPWHYSLASPLQDQPIELKSRNGDRWRPENYDHLYRGEVPLYLGLAKSLNIPTVNLGLQVGVKKERATLQMLGIPGDEIPKVPSIFLGAFTLAPYQVAQMFQAITNQGKLIEQSALRTAVDEDGIPFYQRKIQAKQVVPEQAAWLTTYIMKRVITQGTGKRLAKKYAPYGLAGKTGTTDNNRDSWFVGVDGREVSVIWVGRDDNKPTALTGATGALRIYQNYIAERTPTQLHLPWPKGLTVKRYKKVGNRLEMDSNGSISLPVWKY